MKKFLVLLIAAVVAMGASAGVNKIAPKDFKMKAKKGELVHKNLNLRGGEAIHGLQFKAFDATARPKTNHAFRDGDGTMFWDFEDEAQMNDWTVWDVDEDGYGWEWLYDDEGVGFKTHSGIGCVFSASYENNFGALYPDNWLVSPYIELGGTFGFYACGQDPSWASEVFGVYVLINNEWIQLGEDMTATGNMKAYSFDLSEYEGQEGCVAIVHHNVTDMYRLNVDDITIGEFEPEPEPETPTVITEIPEGCQVYTYARNSACIYSGFFGISGGVTDGNFQVAFDMTNGDVYIQDPAWYLDGYDTWVKGTYDWMTGIITVPVGQYLYWSDAYGYGIILAWGSCYVYEEEDGYYLGTELDDRTTEIQFMIDDDYIYLLGTEGDINAEFPENYNATGMYLYYSDDMSWIATEFCNRDEYGYAAPFGELMIMAEGPAVPADPTADDWYDCGDETGFSKFYFTLPDKDVEGKFLYPEYLSYSIFVDNGNGAEIFHFTGDDYTFDLDYSDDLTEVPYELYSNAVDFHNYYVYMYRTNAEGYEPLFTENIGIQVYYDFPVAREKNASNIVWLYDTDVAVKEVNAGKTVANVRFFNLAGQEMAQPEGLTIKVTTYTDGTSSAVKVVK